MSLLDSLRGPLEQMAMKALPGIIQQILPGGLSALTEQLRRSGYESQVNSWLGRGPNDPITADDLRKVLDSEQVHQMAQKLGIPVDQLFPVLAKALPETIDRHSPDGSVEEPRP